MKKFLLMLFIVLSSHAQAALNKWVDKQGKVHYSDQVPKDVTKAENLQFKSSNDMTPAVHSEGRKSAKKMQDDLQRNKVAHQQRAQKEEQKKANVAVKQTDCINARNNLKLMQQSTRMFNIDENGKRVYMSDSQRRQQLKATKQSVNQICN